MPNMSYCRFENTLADMHDCLEHINDDLDEELRPEEVAAREEMIEVAKQMIDEYMC